MRAEAHLRPLHLLALVGLSPQVVTEAVWCLAHRHPARVPVRITVLTTGAGNHRSASLLPAELGRLAKILGFPVPMARFRVLTDRQGEPLQDIASDADSHSAADAILGAVAEATADEETDLHLSIAGGRKTMGCLAAIALSLYGRPGDVLSHVLVHPKLQNRDDFFFPPETPCDLSLPEGGTLSTAEHGLSLAEIPFVRLRTQWRPERDMGAFAAAVAAAQQSLATPRLALDVGRRAARLGEVELRLPAALFAVLLLLAERAQAGAPALMWRTQAEARLLARNFLATLARVPGVPHHPKVQQALSCGFDKRYLAEKVSRINTAIRAALGPAAEPFLIRPEGRRPWVGYRLRLPEAAISVVECHQNGG